MSDRAAPEIVGRADGPWTSAPSAGPAAPRPSPAGGRTGTPSRVYVDGRQLVIEDPDTGALNLPLAAVDGFAITAVDPSRYEIVVRIEVTGDGRPRDDAVAAHVAGVLDAWRAALTDDRVADPGAAPGSAPDRRIEPPEPGRLPAAPSALAAPAPDPATDHRRRRSAESRFGRFRPSGPTSAPAPAEPPDPDPPIPATVPAPVPASPLRGPDLVPDSMQWIIFSPMYDTVHLAYGTLVVDGSGEPRAST